MRPNLARHAALENLEPRTLYTTVTVTSGTAVEGSAPAILTAALDAPAHRDLTINYRTVNGSARGGIDFTPGRSSIVIPAGQISSTGSIAIADDELYEPDESFSIALSAPRGIALASKRVAVTIVDDAPIPIASIANLAVVEGKKGQTTIAAAQVMLSSPHAQTVRIIYETESISSATELLDYRPARGTVIFRPGQLTADVKLRIIGDDFVEPDESFHVVLKESHLALIPDPFGDITIKNDDAQSGPSGGQLPFASIVGPSPQSEGAAGNGTARFTATLAASAGSSLPTGDVTVSYATSDGTATAGTDYVSTAGVLTFATGETSKTISIPTLGDMTPELDETFSVTLTQATGAIITTGVATATLLNDDDAGEPMPPTPPPPAPPLPTVSIVSTSSIAEGNLVPGFPDPLPATTTLQVPVFLSAPSASNVTVAYTTGFTGDGPGHADSGFDYAATQGTLTIFAGQTENAISIAIAGDLEVELNETFTLTIQSPSGATLGVSTAIVTIVNDDVSAG